MFILVLRLDLAIEETKEFPKNLPCEGGMFRGAGFSWLLRWQWDQKGTFCEGEFTSRTFLCWGNSARDDSTSFVWCWIFIVYVLCAVRIIIGYSSMCLTLALWEPGRSSQSSSFCFILLPFPRSRKGHTGLSKNLSARSIVINVDCKSLEDETLIFRPSVVINPSPAKDCSTDCCVIQPVPSRDFICKDVEFSMVCRTR